MMFGKVFKVSAILLWLSTGVTGTCNETLECLTSDGNQGICMEGNCLSSIDSETRENLEFIIEVRYPENNLQKKQDKNIYLRGNGLGFNWKKGQVMNKTSADSWQVTIKYKSSDDGFRCQGCSDQTAIKDKFQFRVFIGDTINMIGGNFVINLPLSETSSYFKIKPTIRELPWFFSKVGTNMNFTIHSSEIGGNRTIALYLPPSFYENTYKTYPKIFALDFLPSTPTKLIKKSLDSLLVKTGSTKEFILIGYGDYQPANERSDLLTPTPGSFLVCANGTYGDRCDECLPENFTVDEYMRLMREKCGKPIESLGSGDKVLDFLLNTVFPISNTLAQNRIRTDQPNTGIMGYSLGGLMACYAAWTRSSVFGMAACQSPSLWWPLESTKFEDCEFGFLNKTLKDKNLMTNRHPQKILLDAGSDESANPFRLTQSVVEAAEQISKIPFFKLNQNVWVHIYPDKIHSEINWGKRLWTTFKTFLPSNGEPQMPSVTGKSVSNRANNNSLTYGSLITVLTVIFLMMKNG